MFNYGSSKYKYIYIHVPVHHSHFPNTGDQKREHCGKYDLQIHSDILNQTCQSDYLDYPNEIIMIRVCN